MFPQLLKCVLYYFGLSPARLTELIKFIIPVKNFDTQMVLVAYYKKNMSITLYFAKYKCEPIDLSSVVKVVIWNDGDGFEDSLYPNGLHILLESSIKFQINSHKENHSFIKVLSKSVMVNGDVLNKTCCVLLLQFSVDGNQLDKDVASKIVKYNNDKHPLPIVCPKIFGPVSSPVL